MQFVDRRSVSLSKQVFFDASKFVRGASALNACRRGISFAAAAVPSPTPLPSTSPEIKKSRKRVPKVERRAMVQAFVNKYRAMNSGKFPTPSETKNEVGGSYYVIKRIVQELEYEWRTSSLKTKEDILQEKDVSSNDDLTSNSKELQKSHLPLNMDIHTGAQIKDTALKGLETVELEGNSNADEKTLLHGVESASIMDCNSECAVSESHLPAEDHILDSQCEKAEVNLKEKITAEDEQKIDHLKQLVEQHQTGVDFEDSNIQHIEAELGPELSVAEDRLKLDSMKSLDQQQQLTGTVPRSLADSSIQHHKSELGPETSIPIEKTILNDIENVSGYTSNYATSEIHLQAAEAKRVLDLHPVKLTDNLNEKISSQNELKFDGQKPLLEEQQPSEIQQFTRELPNEKKDRAEHKEKPSVWQNLKSFAGGIMSFWRKL